MKKITKRMSDKIYEGDVSDVDERLVAGAKEFYHDLLLGEQEGLNGIVQTCNRLFEDNRNDGKRLLALFRAMGIRAIHFEFNSAEDLLGTRDAYVEMLQNLSDYIYKYHKKEFEELMNVVNHIVDEKEVHKDLQE